MFYIVFFNFIIPYFLKYREPKIIEIIYNEKCIFKNIIIINIDILI